MRQPVVLTAALCLLSSSAAFAQFTQIGPKLVGQGSVVAALQGNSTALSADGNTLIIGGPGDTDGAGAAWVWVRSGGVWTQQSPKLVGSGANGKASQGERVAISADGNTALVGGLTDGYDIGAVWVWVRNHGVWMQQGPKLVGSPAGRALQGCSVALSADGNTAIIGGMYDNNEVGAAWIWTRSGEVWTQQGSKLVGTGFVGQSNQGSGVAISPDGNTAIVGGYHDSTNPGGASWVWVRNGDVWTQQGPKLVGTGLFGANQGKTAALSADGNTALIGGPNGDGAAWVWTRSGGVWTQQGPRLVGPGAAGQALQGISVSLSADGDSAIVGGYIDDAGTGAAWIWKRSSGVWTLQASKLVGSSAAGKAQQGVSVSISADGATAAVGGWYDNNHAGATWVWAKNGEVWSQQGSKLVSTGAGGASQQGYSAALSADGNTAIAGGPLDDRHGFNGSEGAAWVWTRSGGSWSQQGNKLLGSGVVNNPMYSYVGAAQGISTAISADGNTAIVGGWIDNTNVGAAWIWTRSGGVWSQQGKLVSGGGLHQGSSVAISADGNTAIVGESGDSGFAGGAWIWTRHNGVWTQEGTPSATRLAASDATGFAQQGSSVAISADGKTALIGGIGDNNNIGAAWVWIKKDGFWVQQGNKLVASDSVGTIPQQGYSVGLSGDGNTAIIGGYLDNQSQGAAWIWTRSGDVWKQQGPKLAGSGNTGPAEQGTSVSLSADGNTAAVGGFLDNKGIGAVWFWTRSGGVWTQLGAKAAPSDAAGSAHFGSSVSLSADGKTAVIGGAEDDNSQGALWIFSAAPQRRHVARSLEDQSGHPEGTIISDVSAAPIPLFSEWPLFALAGVLALLGAMTRRQ